MFPLKQTSVNHFITGLTFSILWASASIAGKFGLQSVEALIFFTLRFLGAGTLLLFYVYAIKRDRLPAGKEWINVSVFGALSTTLYLGLFILALQSVAAGITALAVALNPLLISILSSLWMKRKVKNREWLSICLGIAGVGVATYPLLQTVHASVEGLILISLSMLAYSIGTVYYSSVTWSLPRITINAWQGFIGGLLLFPFAILFYRGNNHFDLNFWLSLAWLIIIVSIFTVQLWLRLLSDDPVRASLWLFLCPVFGIGFATLLLHEPFLIHTAVGSAIVLSALYLGLQRK